MIMDDVKRIMVLVLPTRECVDVVREAVRFAYRFDASLYVLDVVYNPFAYSHWNLPMPSLDREYERLMQQVRDRLQSMIQEERERGFPVESVVREGEPVEQIMKMVEEEKIDILMLPAHQEARIEHYFSGRVAERLARRMPCSILLVKVEEESLCVS